MVSPVLTRPVDALCSGPAPVGQLLPQLRHRLMGALPFAPNAVPLRFSKTTSSGLGPENADPTRPNEADDASKRASSSLAALARTSSGDGPAGLAIALERADANRDGGATSDGAGVGAGSGSAAGGGAVAVAGLGLAAGGGALAAAFLAAAAACILSCSFDSGFTGLAAGTSASVEGGAGLDSATGADAGGAGAAVGGGSSVRSAIWESIGSAVNDHGAQTR